MVISDIFAFIRLHATDTSRFFALLDTASIHPPNKSVFKRRQELPFITGGRLLSELLPYKDRHLGWTDIFTECKQTSEALDITEVLGCTASRSPHTEFEQISQLPIHKSRQKQAPDIDEISELYELSFNGMGDCISRRGSLASVWRQEWDGKQWYANSGGSHKATALWEYATKGYDVPKVDCEVSVFDFSPHIKNWAKNNKMWVFETKNRNLFSDIHAVIHHQRDIKQRFNEIHISLGNSAPERRLHALTVPLAHPLENKISQRMASSGAFDLADWIRNPTAYTFNANEFLTIPDQAPS